MKKVVVAGVAMLIACSAFAQCETGCKDERTAFGGSIYIGEVIDTFAGDQTINYLNPDAANVSKMRAIAGADFNYRLSGAQGGSRQLWIYGETVHGVRSKDVNCSDSNNVKLSVCSPYSAEVAANPTQQFVAILRGASSLEAFVGLRYELAPTLQAMSDSPARLYVNVQAGFLTVAGGGGDVVDLHKVSVGARAVGGRFEGSFLELGVGRNDLFLRHRTHRAVLDGYMTVDPRSIPFPLMSKATPQIRPFVEFTGDFDFGQGSDSIQTWFGLDFHFK